MSGITLDLIRSSHEGLIRKTKVFCTLGPACWSVEGLGQLIDAGMNIARFNFSHGDHVAHGACLERLRAAIALRPGAHVGVMLDTKGPEIRTGVLDASCGGKLKLVKGDSIEVGTDYSRPCTPSYLVRFVQLSHFFSLIVVPAKTLIRFRSVGLLIPLAAKICQPRK